MPGPAVENDPSLDPSSTQLDVAEILRYLREQRQISARQLSLQAGLSESVVGKIEHRASEPTLRAFAQIVTTLDLNQAEIAFLVRLAARGA
jgi:transcriptional regulator with XRE-family HTH domain